MNRRSFITRTIGALVTAPFIKPKLAIDKLYGIDWGLNDATVGTWMGISRSTVPQFSSHVMYGGAAGGGKTHALTVQMIRKLMDDAMTEHSRLIDRAIYAPQTVHQANNIKRTRHILAGP